MKKKKTTKRVGAVTARPRVHARIARQLGIEIVSGQYRPGHVMDGEVESSLALDVSRCAYREAMRILGAKGLVRSRPRTGTRVSDIGEWHLLDPDVLDWMFSGTPRPEVIHGLFELRSVVEPAAAGLAALRRKQLHLDRMRKALDEMARHTLHKMEGRIADKDFHAALLAATSNPFVASLTNGVTAAVNALTEYKLRRSRVARDPVPDHVRVFDAIAAKDPEAAREAMLVLIRLAVHDMPVSVRPRPAASGGLSPRHPS